MLGTLYRYPHPHDATKFIYCGQGARRDSRHRSGYSSFGRRFKKDFHDVELPQPIQEQIEVENQLELNELETIWMFQYHTWRGYPNGMNLTLPGSQDYKKASALGSSKGGCIGGPIAGRIAVSRGQIQALGRIEGKKGKEEATGIFAISFEERAEIGRRAGRIGGLIGGRATNVSTNGRKGNGGRAAVVSGQLASLQTPEHQRAAFAVLLAKNLNHQNDAARAAVRKNAENGYQCLHKALCQRWNINRNKSCVCGSHGQELAA